MERIKLFFKKIFRGRLFWLFIKLTGWQYTKTKINLCSGWNVLADYWNVDIEPKADLILDLEKSLLPFKNNSMDVVVCISAINYFTRKRASRVIKEVFRVLKSGGITRFGVQDLRVLAQKYLERDEKFFFEKLPNGQDRFPGLTFADKFNQWFFGFPSYGGKTSKYVYDFESLSVLFREAGFSQIEEKGFSESCLFDVKKIDNRPEQMFFLEAKK